MNLWAGFVEWVMSLFGEVELPEWFLGGVGFVTDIINAGAGLGVWVAWPVLLGAVGITFAIWSGGFVVKFARWLLGLLPTMGGG